MDVEAIRQAISDAAGTVTTPQRLVAKHYASDSIDPPWCYPAQTDGVYHETQDDAAGLVVTLRILTSRSEDKAGQELLDAYLSSGSVPAAIERDVSGATVESFSGYQTYEVGASVYYGAELTVTVLA